MDIWRWIYEATDELEAAGHGAYAERLRNLPGHVLSNRHDFVDAAVPELVATARQLRLPWIEVFVRHWHLQSRVLIRWNAAGALTEAVDLLDFATREPARECPQSTCAVQDLAACYGIADGRGYAPERLAVADETLSRIDPSWPCFSCISQEKADALLDAGRAEEAHGFVQTQMERIRAANAADDRFFSQQAHILLTLDRPEEALAVVNGAEKGLDDGHDQQRVKSLRALCLAHLQRWDDAYEALPAFEDVVKSASLSANWQRTVVLLARSNPEHNTSQVDLRLRRVHELQAEHGALRHSLETIEARFELAWARGAKRAATACVAAFETVLDRMERPLDAPETLQRIREALKRLRPRTVSAPPDPQTLLEKLPQDPEEALAALDAAIEANPDHPELLNGLALVLRVVGDVDEALAVARSAFQRFPEEEAVRRGLGFILERHGEEADIDAYRDQLLAQAQAHPDAAQARDLRSDAHFFRARWMFHRGRDREAIADFEAVVEFHPEARNSRVFLARAHDRLGELEAALRWYDDAIEQGIDVGSHDWERMVVATELENWEAVRHSARRLGMELETDAGPIEEAWEVCRIRMHAQGAEEAPVVWARRTGPATATVISMSNPNRDVQHFRSRLVFDPTPLNDGPASDSEAQGHTWLYPLRRVVEPGGHFSFFIDGARLSEAQVGVLESALERAGGEVQLQSTEEYVLVDPDSGREIPAGFWIAAVPEEGPLQSIHEALSELRSQVEGPLVWPGLLARIDPSHPELDGQEGLVQTWALL